MIFIPIIFIVLICAYFVIKVCIKSFDDRTYVYPKTRHKYLLTFNSKLKCPSTGEWFDAVIYKGIEDEKYYVRERKDFFDKFVKLKDWESENKDK